MTPKPLQVYLITLLVPLRKLKPLSLPLLLRCRTLRWHQQWSLKLARPLLDQNPQPRLHNTKPCRPQAMCPQSWRSPAYWHQDPDSLRPNLAPVLTQLVPVTTSCLLYPTTLASTPTAPQHQPPTLQSPVQPHRESRPQETSQPLSPKRKQPNRLPSTNVTPTCTRPWNPVLLLL